MDGGWMDGCGICMLYVSYDVFNVLWFLRLCYAMDLMCLLGVVMKS